MSLYSNKISKINKKGLLKRLNQNRRNKNKDMFVKANISLY